MKFDGTQMKNTREKKQENTSQLKVGHKENKWKIQRK